MVFPTAKVWSAWWHPLASQHCIIDWSKAPLPPNQRCLYFCYFWSHVVHFLYTLFSFLTLIILFIMSFSKTFDVKQMF
jgi:hypothetical protein